MTLDLSSARRTDHSPYTISPQNTLPFSSDSESAHSPPSFSTSTSASSLISPPSPPSPSSSAALASQPSESSRRSSGRPLPLLLNTNNNGDANNTSNKGSSHLPKTSSLGSLPKIRTSTSTIGSGHRSSQDLVSAVHAPQALPSLSAEHSSSEQPGDSAARPALIRRKPLANTASPLASANPASSHDLLEEDDEEDILDFDDYLPTPDQRFTRSGSVDSPTLYEFPSHGGLSLDFNALSSSLPLSPLSVSKQADNKGSSTVFPGSASPETRDAAARALFSRNSPASTPAASQTSQTTTSQHVQDLTTLNLGNHQIHAGEPFNNNTHGEAVLQQEDEDLEAEQEAHHITTRDSTMSLFTRKTSPPHLQLGSLSNTSTTNNNSNSNHKEDDAQRSLSPDQNSVYSAYEEDETETTNHNTAAIHITTQIDADNPNTLKPQAKSPGSFKLGTFFGWPSASPSTTEFSDSAFSPLPSPSPLQLPNSAVTHASALSSYGTNTPSIQDSNRNTKNNSPKKTHASGDDSLLYHEDYLQTPPIITTASRTQSSPSSHSLSPPAQIEEMEDELKAISAELAASIRREMDLEDLVDRLQAEVNSSQPTGKRTSDYFSDSGYISNKFSDYDAAKEEIAQVQRRSEQEKAQIRLELTEKLSDERSRRHVLDQQIKELSERASGLDLSKLQRNDEDSTGRIKQLESTCEDLRRRLSEERGVKENFEDLLSAMKTELESASNERDNLRDEIVPQLRARVEGLESQATEHARQIYETTKLQQELQTLKAQKSFSSSDSSELQQPLASLSRSNTVSKQGQQSAATTESREALAERLKDVEAQRDALHSALKSLLERQEFQNRENDKKIRVLEQERQRLLSASPKKAGYERDVASLREEISVLRRRAEEVLEQKWQVEKGLGGLKMDLDRAEEEIANLRRILQQKDILTPSSSSSRVASNASSVYDTDGTTASGARTGLTTPVTSASLESAYKDLQQSYAEALDRIRKLEASGGAAGSIIPSDEKTSLALQRLEQSLSAAVAERDAARQEVATQKSRLSDAAASEKKLLESESSLAAQLDASARRVEELAQQVRTQLETNSKLRERLTDMLARGEYDQQAHKERITSLESRLRSLEEQLVATQTAAEERVARHEDQVTALKEAHSTQLQRLRDASGSLRAVSPSRAGGSSSPRLLASSQFSPGAKSPMSPMFSVNGRLMPPAPPSSRPSSRGSMTSGGAAADQEQQAQVATLKARVSELESALASADKEMQEVVGRMNTAQIEVMQLQEERENAVRETRRLQRQIETEQVKTFEERFRMLSRSATTA